MSYTICFDIMTLRTSRKQVWCREYILHGNDILLLDNEMKCTYGNEI